MAKDHVTVSNVAGGHLLTCTHCGQTETVALPMEWRKWKIVTGRFQKQHRHCLPPAGTRPDDALQTRHDAAIAALIKLARAHYSYYQQRSGHYRDDAIGRRIFSDYESESDALFRVLEAEGLIRGMDDEEGGYAFVSDLADAAADGQEAADDEQ